MKKAIPKADIENLDHLLAELSPVSDRTKSPFRARVLAKRDFILAQRAGGKTWPVILAKIWPNERTRPALRTLKRLWVEIEPKARTKR
ncbi:MAG TPA: hypothetical protein VNF68_06060 [Candidatus Baltobacteraceae bacterium]|nr:hypothetical protein [Candidatus Baltobacteraceae bacterium]